MKPQLILCCGGMFSGKTTRLLSYVERFKYQNKNIKAYKPKIDDRYSLSEISTHSGMKLNAVTVSNGEELWLDFISSEENIDVVVVDELFMIPNAPDVLIDIYNLDKTVVVSSLDLSSKYKPFEAISKLFFYATLVDKCIAVCTICYEDAHFTQSKEENENDIVVGASEKYEARCHKHYNTRLNINKDNIK